MTIPVVVSNVVPVNVQRDVSVKVQCLFENLVGRVIF